MHHKVSFSISSYMDLVYVKVMSALEKWYYIMLHGLLNQTYSPEASWSKGSVLDPKELKSGSQRK